MKRDEVFWKKRGRRYSRPIGLRGDPKDRILIVCEGGKTEPNYFKSFRVSSSVVLDIQGIGDNTVNLVNYAMSERSMAKKEGNDFHKVWCVFDRNSFPASRFNEAIELAKRERINVAYSNEAFELWYLLHFSYVDTALHRNDYENKLDGWLGHKYRKNSNSMYEKLLERQQDALRNARRLLEGYKTKNPEKDNPSTTVHLLIEELNKYL